MLKLNWKIYLLMGSLLGVIFLILILKVFVKPKTLPVQTPSPTAIPSVTSSATNIPLVQSSSIPQAYSDQQLKKDFERISNRKPLSSQDDEVKKKLIQLSSGQKGLLVEASSYRAEYVKTPDLFMVEILIPDTNLAMDAATSYFKRSGLSQEGICNLPVVFYLNYAINNYFKTQKREFDPIPKGCN